MKIAILCGGASTEREVSLKSGAAVEKGLQDAGFETVLLDVSSIPGLLKELPLIGADCAFIALHGGWGEDGRLQSALDEYGIRYTGSGAVSCFYAMDKEITRVIFKESGIPIPPGTTVEHPMKFDLEEAIERWGKIVIKPASGGSTVGVVITDDRNEAADALISVLDIDTKAIVEKFIPGRELTVAVFSRGAAAFAMPAVEIRPKSGFYDYSSKYTAGATEYICPAELSEETSSLLAKYACTAHLALECRTYSRVDFRVTEGGEVFALEANTAPGMTATSLVPKAAAAYGWNFPRLLTEIVNASTTSC